MAQIKAKESYSQYQSILSDLVLKKYKPFYLLMGEEPYYIDKLSRYLSEHILTPEEQGFNQIILYGSDATALQIVETGRRYPMMAQRQVVVVREAQQVRELEKSLEVYLRQAPETTVLVICYPGKTVDKRTAFYKAALAKGAVLESVVLREDEVAGWISRYAAEMKAEITPEAAVLLADYLGTDLNKITMELNKLLMLLPVGQRRITPEVIEQNVGISKEHSPFSLCKAISYRDLPTALKIVRYFGENAKSYPFVMVNSVLFSHFARIVKYHAMRQGASRVSNQEIASALGLHPFFLNEIEAAARNFSIKQTAHIISLLRIYDGRYKSNERGEAEDGALLQEIIYKILRNC
jgi:DNA polymerase-3 subunit delta